MKLSSKKVLMLVAASLLVGCANKATQTDAKTTSAQAAAPAVAKEVVTPSVGTEDKSNVTAGKETICKKSSDERKILIPELKSGKSCKVFYTKAGNTERVAAANNKGEFCSQVADKIVQKLKKAGFDCN